MNLDQKYNVPQLDGDTVPPGPAWPSLANFQLTEYNSAGQAAFLQTQTLATDI